MFRVLVLLLALVAASVRADPIDDAVAASRRVNTFLAALWPDAKARGVTRATFDLALSGFTPDPRVIAATHSEPEYIRPVGAYLEAVVSRSRIATGAAKAGQWAAVLDRIEQQYGVERWIVLALWGIESSFGAGQVRWDVIRSLATLA